MHVRAQLVVLGLDATPGGPLRLGERVGCDVAVPGGEPRQGFEQVRPILSSLA